MNSLTLIFVAALLFAIAYRFYGLFLATKVMNLRAERETRGAVKGVARRVVIVSDPDPTVFEEAIFVVREDFGGGRTILVPGLAPGLSPATAAG